jgi:type II secretory pathway pseudopilin PulG
MTRNPRPDDGPERGSTLVEQLVVMILLTGLGLLVATVTIDLTRNSSELGRRVTGLHQQQLALEVLTRDLRAAHPLVSTVALPCEPGRQPSTTPAALSCANALVLDLTRQGSRWRVSYELATGSLTRTRQQWTGSSWSTATTTVLASGLVNGTTPASPVFALTDATGQPVTSVGEVSRVNVLLAVRIPRLSEPSTIAAEVTVRNRVTGASA